MYRAQRGEVTYPKSHSSKVTGSLQLLSGLQCRDVAKIFLVKGIEPNSDLENNVLVVLPVSSERKENSHAHLLPWCGGQPPPSSPL